MVFLDLEKAYDKDIKAIKDIYSGTKTRARTMRGDSEHSPVVMVLQQGSTLNSFLFALVMGELSLHI